MSPAYAALIAAASSVLHAVLQTLKLGAASATEGEFVPTLQPATDAISFTAPSGSDDDVTAAPLLRLFLFMGL